MDDRLVKYRAQKNNAKRRGIDWELTFDQWWQLWDASNRWNQRGREVGNYAMCRNNDVGPYAFGNVKIKTITENRYDDWEKRKRGYQKRDPFRTEPRDHLPPEEQAWYTGREIKLPED